MTEHVTPGDTCDTFSGFAASRAHAKRPTQKHVTPTSPGDTSDTFSTYQLPRAHTLSGIQAKPRHHASPVTSQRPTR